MKVSSIQEYENNKVHQPKKINIHTVSHTRLQEYVLQLLTILLIENMSEIFEINELNWFQIVLLFLLPWYKRKINTFKAGAARPD